MSTSQRWVLVAVIGTILVLAVVGVLLVPRSRVGSLPPGLPPLPCGDDVLVTTLLDFGSKAMCVRGHVWFYSGGQWSPLPSPRDLISP